jgi:hypothetical protein
MRLCASKSFGTCYPLPKASPGVVYPPASDSIIAERILSSLCIVQVDRQQHLHKLHTTAAY